MRALNNTSEKLLVIDVAPKMDRFVEVIKCFAQLCAVFEAFGVTRIQKLRTSEQLMGDAAVKATAIVNFPDSASIKNVFSSAEFAALENIHEILYETFSVRICDGH